MSVRAVHLDDSQIAAVEKAGEAYMRANRPEPATALFSIVLRWQAAAELPEVSVEDAFTNVVWLDTFSRRVGA